MDPDLKAIRCMIENIVKEKEGEERKGLLARSLGLRERDVISIVGAGGKTTLMFRLAKELLLHGKHVVTTTTTKIFEPASVDTPCLFVDLDEAKLKQFVGDHLDEYRHVTIASERLGSGKLQGVSPDLAVDLWKTHLIDYLVIEADGAARRPVKAPREKEPVIASNTTLVIAILGMDGLGMPLNEENVFQPERLSRMTRIPLGKRITEEGMAIVMTHAEGIFKGAPSLSRVVAFLNKVDIPKGVEKARGVARRILEKKHPQIERVVLGQLSVDPPVADIVFP